MKNKKTARKSIARKVTKKTNQSTKPISKKPELEKVSKESLKRKKYWLKGIFYGWTISIFCFFIFIMISDELLFMLLYPGWFITSFIKTPDFTVPFFGSIMMSVIFISFFSYCLLGYFLGLVYGKFKYKTFFDPNFTSKIREFFKKIKNLKIYQLKKIEKKKKSKKPIKTKKEKPKK